MTLDPIHPTLRAKTPVTATYKRCGRDYTVLGYVATDCAATASTVRIMAIADAGGFLAMDLPRRAVEKMRLTY